MDPPSRSDDRMLAHRMRPSDLPSAWPQAAGRGASLICCRIDSRVDDVFRSLWIEQELVVRRLQLSINTVVT